MVTRTSRILGPDGQPIQLADLTEPQTSRVGNLHREFQGHPGRGLTPSKLAALLVGAEQGDVIAQYELFEDMEERDGHILSEMSKRRRAVSGLPLTIVPPPNPSAAEKAEAERLGELVESIEDIDGIVFDTTDAIGKGFSCQEIKWQRINGEWLPEAIEHRPQSWFKLFRGFTQEIRLRDNSADGEPLQPFGWITHKHRARSGYLERANLFRALVWPYLFKNYSVSDLAEFLEIYGIPLRLGKYPPGAGDKEKTTLLRALLQIGHNAAGIIPDGMSIEFQKAADGDPAAFQLMMDWCERTASKVILGGTLTSQADRGSNTNALGNVHNEVRKELKDSDARQVEATLSRDLVYPLAVLNGMARNGFRRCPRVHLDTAESKDIGAFATSLPALVKLGMKIKRSWAHTELGIPEAEDDTDILVDQQPSPTQGVVVRSEKVVDPEALRKALSRTDLGAIAALTASGDPDPAALLARQLDRRQTAPAKWVEELRTLLDGVQSLDEFRDRLMEVYAGMTLDAYADMMALATSVGRLAGRSDVEDQGRGDA